MKWDSIIAKITSHPSSPGRTRLSINMPVTISKKEDGNFHIYLDVFGGLKSFTNDESKIDQTIYEALKLFFINAQEYGDGWHNELLSLGWQVKRHSIRYKSSDERLKAGTPKKLELAL